VAFLRKSQLSPALDDLCRQMRRQIDRGRRLLDGQLAVVRRVERLKALTPEIEQATIEQLKKALGAYLEVPK
jgi:hypothetical protein